MLCRTSPGDDARATSGSSGSLRSVRGSSMKNGGMTEKSSTSAAPK